MKYERLFTRCYLPEETVLETRVTKLIHYYYLTISMTVDSVSPSLVSE